MKRSSPNLFSSRFRVFFKNYQFKSLFFRYMRMIFLGFFIILLLFSAVFTYMSIQNRKTEARLEAERNLVSSANTFEMALRHIAIYHEALLRSPALSKAIMYSKDTFLRYQEGRRNSTLCKTLSLELRAECTANSTLDSIQIYLCRSGFLVGQTQDGSRETYYDSDWLEEASPTQSVIIYRTIASVNTQVISIIRPVLDAGNCTAYICYNLRYYAIVQMLNPWETETDYDVCLLNQDGTVIFSSQSEKLNRNVSELPELYRTLSFEPDSNGNFSALVEKNFTSLCRSFPQENLTLLYSADSTGYRSSLRQLMVSLLIAVPMGLLVCAVLSAVISLRLYDYIFRILHFFQYSNCESLKEDSAEISDIRQSILNITNRSQNLEAAFTEKLIELKKAQTVALQTQINPHFILNTLQALCFSFMEVTRKDTRPGNIILLLSEILRSNLNTSEYLIPVAEELNIAKKYLELEKLRNNNGLSVVWDTTAETLSMNMLRFSMQPLLENCILHGLSESDKPEKRITIQTKILEQPGGRSLTVTVADNGVGMTPEKLAELQSSLQNSHLPEKSHIGILNVNMRYRLIYGAQGGVTISSLPEMGTQVTLSIPL